jgi:hypothetical protein
LDEREGVLKNLECFVEDAKSGSEPADPNASGGWFAEMNAAPRDTKRHGFVVTAVRDIQLDARKQVKILEKCQKALILFVNAQNFGGIFRTQLGEENATLLSKLRNAALNRNTVRAGFSVSETFQQQRLDFRGNGVLHALGFGVRLRPRQPDDVREQHFGELMANHEALSDFAAFGSEEDLAAALHLDMSVARHAFQGCGNRGRSDIQLFGEARADGNLILLKHFPNGLEVIFLRNAGFLAAQ